MHLAIVSKFIIDSTFRFLNFFFHLRQTDIGIIYKVFTWTKGSIQFWELVPLTQVFNVVYFVDQGNKSCEAL